MGFEYKPIKFTETRRIKSPKHQISRNIVVDYGLNKGVYFLERILGIKHDNLDIYESTYQTPIKTEHPENNIGRVRYYKAFDKSAVIVLPQRNSGFDMPERSSGYNIAQLVASYLAAHGISAYEIETPLNGSRRAKVPINIDLNKLKTIFNQAVTETRALTDLIQEEKIGIFGVSLGAAYSSIIFGVDGRITSACLALGGGNFANMVFESNERFIQYLRAHIAKDGISREELREKLEEIEPCSHTNPDKKENLIMINAVNDKSVPVKYGNLLRQAWGNPKQYLLNTGHLTAIREIPKLLPIILEHFKRTLI